MIEPPSSFTRRFDTCLTNCSPALRPSSGTSRHRSWSPDFGFCATAGHKARRRRRCGRSPSINVRSVGRSTWSPLVRSAWSRSARGPSGGPREHPRITPRRTATPRKSCSCPSRSRGSVFWSASRSHTSRRALVPDSSRRSPTTCDRNEACHRSPSIRDARDSRSSSVTSAAMRTGCDR